MRKKAYTNNLPNSASYPSVHPCFLHVSYECTSSSAVGRSNLKIATHVTQCRWVLGGLLREVDIKVNGHIHIVYFLLKTPPPLPFDVTPFEDVYVTDVHLLCDPMPNNVYMYFHLT